MTILLTGLPGVSVWIPAAWDAWTLYGIDYRRTLAGIDFSVDGRDWQAVPSKVLVENAPMQPAKRRA